MSTTQSTQDTNTPNTDSSNVPSTESQTVPTNTTNSTNKNTSSSQTDNDDSVPSYTFADALKTLVKPTDLDKPIDYYQYDTNPNIVNIITGEGDIEKTDDNYEMKEIEDVQQREFKEPVEIDYNNDINKYDIQRGEIPEKLLPINYPDMHTSQDEKDIPEDDTTKSFYTRNPFLSMYVFEPDDIRYDTFKKIYTRNPYLSTFVFFIPAVSFIMIILGFRGILTFNTFIYALAGSSVIWFFISWVISSTNKAASNQGLFNSGEVNKAADTLGLLTIADNVLKMIDETLIKALFSVVNFFTSFFRESLQLKNIRKMFFILTLSIVMMGLLFVLNLVFKFPLAFPSSLF
jgi:hypothetical protein